jgi:hypothetical protein
MRCTSPSKPGISTAQATTLSSSKSASLPPNEHANAFCHQEIHFIRYSELGFWSHTGLNMAYGTIATLSGDMHVLTHRSGCRHRANISLLALYYLRRFMFALCLRHVSKHKSPCTGSHVAPWILFVNVSYLMALPVKPYVPAIESSLKRHSL